MKYPYKEKQAQLLAYNMMRSYIRNEPELGEPEKEGRRKELAKTALEQARRAVYGAVSSDIPVDFNKITGLTAPIVDSTAEELTVMDILEKMSHESLESVKLMCKFAADKRAPPSTYAELRAAKHIYYHMNKAEQKVSHYLIGRAQKEHSVPAVLALF